MATETPEAYARQLKALLPPGRLWNLEPDSKLSKVLLALADELSRVAARARALIEEADPRTAVETLDDWERMLGLPDADVVEIPSTIEERQLAVTQKFVRRGGQTAAYFIALAAACGYVATVTDDGAGDVLRAGFRCGDRCYGTAWAFVWTMNVQPPSGAALSHASLEAIIRRAAPSHTVIFFAYL